MFRLKKEHKPFPSQYDHIVRKNPTKDSKGYDKMVGPEGEFYLRDKIDFAPQKGIQENACRDNSDVIFLAGAIQMGKTYLQMLKALYGMDKPGYSGRFISVRLQDSKKGSSLYRDAVEIWGNFAECQYTSSDYPAFTWPQTNSSVLMTHSNFNVDNPSEYLDFKEFAKKNSASYIAVDEATDMCFKMWTYWFARNRDASGMKPCMILSFNPEYQHFTTQMLLDGGYIGSDYFVIPEMVGKQRFFYIDGDEPENIIWGDTRAEVAARANIVITEKEAAAGITPEDVVKSFNFYTGEAADNLKLLNATSGGAIANMHAVGGTQRKVLKQGYFGPVDNLNLTVSRSMIRDLFTNPIYGEGMYATLDVSGGDTNSDNCPMIIWEGLRIIAIEMFKGTAKELVDWIGRMLKKYNVPIYNFCYDSTGIGGFLKSYTAGVPITANKAAFQEYDENGNQVTSELFFNVRSQLLGRMKVLIETGKISIGLAPEYRLLYGKKGEKQRLIDIIYTEMDLFAVTTKNKRIYYESKDIYKSRHQKNSPDLMDSICLRAYWELDARPKKQPSPEVEDDAYFGLYEDCNGRNAIWI